MDSVSMLKLFQEHGWFRSNYSTWKYHFQHAWLTTSCSMCSNCSFHAQYGWFMSTWSPTQTRYSVSVLLNSSPPCPWRTSYKLPSSSKGRITTRGLAHDCVSAFFFIMTVGQVLFQATRAIYFMIVVDTSRPEKRGTWRPAKVSFFLQSDAIWNPNGSIASQCPSMQFSFGVSLLTAAGEKHSWRYCLLKGHLRTSLQHHQ